MEDRPAPVQVTIGGTTSLLLMKLMQELRTEDGGGVISRALSLYDMALTRRRQGMELCFIDPATGHKSEVAL